MRHRPPQCIDTLPVSSESASPSSGEWDAHWTRQKSTFFGTLCSLYRRHIRARSVAHSFEKYFPRSGVFAECGSGTSETSCRIQLHQRRLIAVDFSRHALARAEKIPQIAECIHADLRDLPFADQSLDGIWNLGVMEHFDQDEQLLILKAFHRALKPDGLVLLWWPPKWALDRTVLAPFGWNFPTEPGRVTRKEAASLLEAAGFHKIQVRFPISDAFTELLAVGSA